MNQVLFLSLALVTGLIFWGAVIHGVERAWARLPVTRELSSPLTLLYRHHRRVAGVLLLLNALILLRG